MTPSAAIDKSKILSDWVRQSDTLEVREKQLKEKDEIIRKLSLKASELTGQLKALNYFISSKTEQVDEITEEQINIAKGMFSDFQVNLRAHGNITAHKNLNTGIIESGIFTYLQADLIIKYNIKKWYIVTQGSVGFNDYTNISLGGGYRLF